MMGGLPRRDLFLLPLVAVVTVLGLLLGAEALAMQFWQEHTENSCRIADPTLRFRFKPNCSSTMKTSEGPWYRNDYNECGYRSLTSCGPVPAGTRRVALIGSSLSEGHLVEFPHTIAERLRIELSAGCGAPVDVQNLGANTYSAKRVLFRMNEALTLRPDAIFADSWSVRYRKASGCGFCYFMSRVMHLNQHPGELF